MNKLKKLITNITEKMSNSYIPDVIWSLLSLIPSLLIFFFVDKTLSYILYLILTIPYSIKKIFTHFRYEEDKIIKLNDDYLEELNQGLQNLLNGVSNDPDQVMFKKVNDKNDINEFLNFLQGINHNSEYEEHLNNILTNIDNYIMQEFQSNNLNGMVQISNSDHIHMIGWVSEDIPVVVIRCYIKNINDQMTFKYDISVFNASNQTLEQINESSELIVNTDDIESSISDQVTYIVNEVKEIYEDE